MADKPIIFSAPMVRALLDGRKTQTRRVLKIKWRDGVNTDFTGWRPERVGARHWQLIGGIGIGANILVPYTVGDRLWVREGFSYDRLDVDRDGTLSPWYWADGNPDFGDWSRHKPSIHMPRWASRLTLTATEVRVQRLQDISEADAMAEGYNPPPYGAFGIGWSPVGWFADLWNSVYGPEAWAANPWVAALSFDVHHCNIDRIGGAG